MRRSTKSISRFSSTIKKLESIEGEKFIGRIVTTCGRAFTLIKGDKVVVIRRRKVIHPK